MKGGKARGKKGGQGREYTAILTLPLDLQHFFRAKTKEAHASTFEKSTHGAKHISDIYANLKKKPVNGTPSVQTFDFSITAIFRDKRNCVNLLISFLSSVEIAAYALEVLDQKALKKIGVRIADELSAQTGLKAPKRFAAHVNDYVRHETDEGYEDGLRHVYFLFHPDNNWHPEFRSLVKEKPLPENLLGMSENLDSLVVWMKFIRSYLNRVKRRKSETMFHIIIPAYEITVIKDPLEFPDLGLLMIHGELRRQQPYVWLNLPTIENYPGGGLTLKDIGNIARPDSKWKDAATIATAVGTASAVTAASVGTCKLCPPVTPIMVIAGPVAAVSGAFYAARAVRKRLSKETPRILSSNNWSKDGADADEKDSGDSGCDEDRTPADIVYQPETKHVSRHRHRHGHRQHRHRRS